MNTRVVLYVFTPTLPTLIQSSGIGWFFEFWPYSQSGYQAPFLITYQVFLIFKITSYIDHHMVSNFQKSNILPGWPNYHPVGYPYWNTNNKKIEETRKPIIILIKIFFKNLTLVLRAGAHTSPPTLTSFSAIPFFIKKVVSKIKFQRACMLWLWSHNRTWL